MTVGTWVLLVCALVVVALVATLGLACWLWRRAAALTGEVAALGRRLDEVTRLADDVHLDASERHRRGGV
ncbi:hypothetical protein GCM10027418_29040 [Mariniluteicoccus endophyticus]